jgi:hypothetical protein
MDMSIKNVRLVASFEKCGQRVRFDAACELIYIYNLAKDCGVSGEWLDFIEEVLPDASERMMTQKKSVDDAAEINKAIMLFDAIKPQVKKKHLTKAFNKTMTYRVKILNEYARNFK